LKALVTGGCGFIGSHVAEGLVNRGFTVTVLDDLSLGTVKNIEELGVKFVKGDSQEVASMSERFDVLVHIGIPSSSPMYKRNPYLISKAVNGTLSVLEYAKRSGAKVVLASTSSIYNGNPIPWREDMKIYVTDYYTEARLCCERLCELYSRLYGVECVALRYFSVYGEREEHKGSYANVITQMLWAALKGEEFVVYGDGSQTRDLVYVKDVVEANIKAIEFSDYTGDVKFEVFNVGTGVATSFNDMAKLLEEKGFNVKLKYAPNPIKNYVYHTLADMSKAKSILKFNPRHEIREVIPKVAEYYRRKLNL